MRFVATGGVGPGNGADFLAAGCAAVVVGSALAAATALPQLREALGRGAGRTEGHQAP